MFASELKNSLHRLIFIKTFKIGRVSTDTIDTKNSLNSKLHFESISSVWILNTLKVIHVLNSGPSRFTIGVIGTSNKRNSTIGIIVEIICELVREWKGPRKTPFSLLLIIFLMGICIWKCSLKSELHFECTCSIQFLPLKPSKTRSKAADQRHLSQTNMRDELKEVIRVLQLVHYDVDGWEPISVSELKRLKEHGFLDLFL